MKRLLSLIGCRLELMRERESFRGLEREYRLTLLSRWEIRFACVR